MGRSVSYPQGDHVVAVCFRTISEDDYGHDDFDFIIEDIQESMQAHFPSFRPCDRWIGRELRVVVQNTFCSVVVSEYCGLVSVSLVVDDVEPHHEGLAIGFANRIESRFRAMFGQLVKVGTMSNGEGVYESIGG